MVEEGDESRSLVVLSTNNSRVAKVVSLHVSFRSEFPGYELQSFSNQFALIDQPSTKSLIHRYRRHRSTYILSSRSKKCHGKCGCTSTPPPSSIVVHNRRRYYRNEESNEQDPPTCSTARNPSSCDHSRDSEVDLNYMTISDFGISK